MAIEIDVVACCVVDPPRIVDPVHFGRPDVAATGSCLVGPDDFRLSGLQTADGLGSCEADVRPCGGQEIVVAIARVNDERIGAIFGYQRVGERSTQSNVEGRCQGREESEYVAHVCESLENGGAIEIIKP